MCDSSVDASSSLVGSTQWDKQIEGLVSDLVQDTATELTADVRHMEKEMKKAVMFKN